MLISLRAFRLSAAVSEEGGGGETAQSKLEKVLDENFLKCYQVFQQVLGTIQDSSSLLFFWEGKWYIFIQEVQKSLLSGKRRPFFTSFIRGKNPLCRSSQKADFPHPFSAFFPLLTWALSSFIFCNTWTSSSSRSCSSIIMDYQSSFLTAKELVANSEKRALSTKKGSPGTFSNFQGRAEAEPLMRLLLCLFPLNSQLPCQEWHFSIASSKKVHLESSRSPAAESSYIHYSILMAPTITYSRMHISISKGQ